MVRNNLDDLTDTGTPAEEEIVSFSVEEYAEKQPTSPPGRRRANLLLFLTSKTGPAVLPYLARNPNLNLRVINALESQWNAFLTDGDVFKDVEWFENRSDDTHHNIAQLRGHQLAKWAD